MNNDNELRTQIAELLNALREWRCIHDILLQRGAHIRQPNFRDPADVRRWAGEYGPILIDTASTLCNRLSRHGRAIRRRTDDITAAVKTLERVTRMDLREIRDVMSRAEHASEGSDGARIVGRAFGASFGMALRKKQFDAAMLEVETYYLLRFAA
jgi:hypothetical protein